MGHKVIDSGSASAIEVRELTKHYDDVQAVDHISFDVHPGEIFGFLGPNGAGKTTTINMLTGLACPTGGTISMFGHDYTQNIKRAQHLMGIVPDESNLYPELSGFENLCFCAALYGMRRCEREERAETLLDMVGLAEVGSRKFATYSKGMKRKLTIAAGIVHDPQLLFLDEPTTGIDVASARKIRQMLAALNKAESTIFLTTHYIEEAERLCDRIAFIVGGRIVALDTLDNLMRDVQGTHIVQFSLGPSGTDIRAEFEKSFPDLACEPLSGPALRIHAKDRIDLVPLIRFFEEREIQVSEARVIQPSLEDVFVRITGIEIERMKGEKEQGRRGGQK